MNVTTKFTSENSLQTIMLDLLKSRIDSLIEQSYDNMQANTVTSQKHNSKGENVHEMCHLCKSKYRTRKSER